MTINNASDLDAAIAAAATDDQRAECVERATALTLADHIPAGWNADGTLKDDPASRTEPVKGSAAVVTRSYVLDDISIRADGTGRTVIAYCAPFDVDAEITDNDGHYTESLSRTSFDKTLSERAGQISCYYNHARTIFGTPSDLFSIPLGTPKDIRADGRGVRTETLYGRSNVADLVLDLINDGAPMGMSFSGRFMPGRSQRTRGTSGALDRIVRQEVAMNEYGPTPHPAYREAVILGTRSGTLLVTEIAETVVGLPDDTRRELIHVLGTFRTTVDPATTAAAVAEAVPPAADAAQTGTSATNDTPPPGAPVGLSQSRQRRAKALALTSQVPKGP